MNVAAVLLREMRAEARHGFTYWLRVVGGAAVLLFAAILMLGNLGTGRVIFANLNGLLFTSIWIIVPLLTADCISQERREGTLGLLFLTPLTSTSIVIAKAAVHSLRGFSYLLTALPAVIVPVLLGGVGAPDLARAALVDVAAVLLALAAGILASALSTRWSRAMLAAELLSLCSALPLAKLHSEYLSMQSYPSLGDQWARLAAGTANGGALSPHLQLEAAAQFFAVGLSGFGLAVLFSGNRVRQSWQFKETSPRQRWLLQVFCTPRYWKGFFRRKLSRTLERNPIGWLQQYSWSARLAKWSWCLALVIYDVLLLGSRSWDNAFMWSVLPVLAASAAVAFTAAGSFARERRNGAMELILVTPLSVSQIVLGRMRGVLGQFIPTGGLWLLGVVAICWNNTISGEYLLVLILPVSTAFTCAFVGLYYSLRRINFIAGWMLTCLLSTIVPAFAAGAMLFLVAVFKDVTNLEPEMLVPASFVFCQLIACWIAWRALTRNLTRRDFAFN